MTVEQLWERTKGSLAKLDQSGVDFITAVNEATEQIFNYLWKRKSDLAKEPFSLRFRAGSSGGVSLPDEFRGFAERPSIDDVGFLDTFLEVDRERVQSETGDPSYYELIGQNLFVYPTPAKGTIIKGIWFQKPDDVTSFDDDLPFNTVMEAAYTSMVIAIAGHGIDADLTVILDSKVATLLAVRNHHSPPRTQIRDF